VACYPVAPFRSRCSSQIPLLPFPHPPQLSRRSEPIVPRWWAPFPILLVIELRSDPNYRYWRWLLFPFIIVTHFVGCRCCLVTTVGLLRGVDYPFDLFVTFIVGGIYPFCLAFILNLFPVPHLFVGAEALIYWTTHCPLPLPIYLLLDPLFPNYSWLWPSHPSYSHLLFIDCLEAVFISALFGTLGRDCCIPI